MDGYNVYYMSPGYPSYYGAAYLHDSSTPYYKLLTDILREDE